MAQYVNCWKCLADVGFSFVVFVAVVVVIVVVVVTVVCEAETEHTQRHACNVYLPLSATPPCLYANKLHMHICTCALTESCLCTVRFGSNLYGKNWTWTSWTPINLNVDLNLNMDLHGHESAASFRASPTLLWPLSATHPLLDSVARALYQSPSHSAVDSSDMAHRATWQNLDV